MQTRLVATIASLIAVVALTSGCSGSDNADATKLVSESHDTTLTQTSAHVDLAVEGRIAALPIQSLSGDLTRMPGVAASGTLDMTYLGQPLVGVEFVVFEGRLWAAITSGSAFADFGPASDVYDVSTLLDPDTGLANLLAVAKDVRGDGSESIGGVDATRITGTLSADAVNQFIPQIGATDPVPTTFWIATGGDHELLQVRLEPSSGNSVTLTFSKWGEPVTVENPAP